MKGFPKFLMTIGRMCISLIFILAGINQIIHWQDSEKNLTSGLSAWHSYAAHSEIMGPLFAHLLLWPTLILVLAVICELLGGLLVFFGAKVRFGAFLLLLVFLPSIFLFNPFWFMEGMEKANQMILFYKSIAILGGIFCVLAVGGTKKPAKPSAPPAAPIKK